MRPGYHRRARREWLRARKLVGRLCGGAREMYITWRVWYRPMLLWMCEEWRAERREAARGMRRRR